VRGKSGKFGLQAGDMQLSAQNVYMYYACVCVCVYNYMYNFTYVCLYITCSKKSEKCTKNTLYNVG